ncbi:hypothetical protein L1987_71033 [Smallanthus sonchifolius]|uniref:Uncharacterized protein n=1 Tax=Smallanthus sonchifolius TaxID=185202 RepID=A0ACB9AR88_9ASTR|nr:hypothetical protein L1987_71033 [Smallanthus sonchifolius]
MKHVLIGEEDAPPPILEGKITGISFSLAAKKFVSFLFSFYLPVSSILGTLNYQFRYTIHHISEVAQVTVIENQKKDGACFLELKLPSRKGIRDDFWDFLDRYGYRYGGDAAIPPLLPSEVLEILKKIAEATKKKLDGRGCFFQEVSCMV